MSDTCDHCDARVSDDEIAQCRVCKKWFCGSCGDADDRLCFYCNLDAEEKAGAVKDAKL